MFDLLKTLKVALFTRCWPAALLAHLDQIPDAGKTFGGAQFVSCRP